MKYAIVIPEGAADLASPELGGATPLESADLPCLQSLARSGRVGYAAVIPEGVEPSSGAALLSLLGNDARTSSTGGAAFEAIARGLALSSGAWVFRFGFFEATTGDDEGVRIGDAPVLLSEEELRVVAADLEAYWGVVEPGLAAGVSLRILAAHCYLVIANGAELSRVRTIAPDHIVRAGWRGSVPQGGPGAARLTRLMEVANSWLPGHSVNRARVEQGLACAAMVWAWDGGEHAPPASFLERFGLRAGMATTDDLAAGVALTTGLERLHAPPEGDQQLAEVGRRVVDALTRLDVVCCHVPLTASAIRDGRAKIELLESLDQHIIAPIAAALSQFGDPEREDGRRGWRMLVCPAVTVPCSTGRPTAVPVPFMIAGSWVRSVVERAFTEQSAAESDLQIDHGHELMEYFLRGGVPVRRG